MYLGSPVLLKGRRPPSLFLAGGGSELEGLEEEDGRVALSWAARALGRPDLKFETEEEKKRRMHFPIEREKREEYIFGHQEERRIDLRRVGLRERGAWRSGHEPPPLEQSPEIQAHFLHTLFIFCIQYMTICHLIIALH